MVKDHKATRTIALMNQKGGVGKTTTAVNLGAGLARRGAHVLLVDLDPQAHLTLHVGLDPAALDASVYDVLLDEGVSAYEVVHEVDRRLSVIPSEVDLAGAERELSDGDWRMILRRKLAPLAGAFDFVLMDCPPSLGLLTVNALTAASEVIVPMQAHFLALQGFTKLMDTVERVRERMNPDLRVSGVVLAMHDAQTNLAAEVVSELENFFEAWRDSDKPWARGRVYQPPIRRNVRLAESPSFGRTVLGYDPRCAGAADYRALAKAVMGGKKRN